MGQYDTADYRKHIIKVYKAEYTVYYDMLTDNQIITMMKCQPAESDYTEGFYDSLCMIAGEQFNHWVGYGDLLSMFRVLGLEATPYRGTS